MPTTVTMGAIAQSASAATISVAYPSGIQAGDHLYIVGLTSDSYPSATGFTRIAYDGDDMCFLHKVATGSESGNITVDQGVAAAISVAMIRVSSPGKTLYLAEHKGKTSTADPCTIPLTTKHKDTDDFVLSCYMSTAARTWTTPPSGYTSLGSTTSGPSLWVGYLEGASSATTTMDASGTALGFSIRVVAVGDLKATTKLYAGTIADAGPIAWSNPNYAKTSDNLRATFTTTVSGDRSGLNATNFGFTIPSNAIIHGVVATVECNGQSAGSEIKWVGYNRLRYSGAVLGGVSGTSDASMTTSDAFYDGGSNMSLWAAALTPAIVNDSTFGFSAHITGYGASAQQRIDSLALTIYYEEVPVGGSLFFGSNF